MRNQDSVYFLKDLEASEEIQEIQKALFRNSRLQNADHCSTGMYSPQYHRHGSVLWYAFRGVIVSVCWASDNEEKVQVWVFRKPGVSKDVLGEVLLDKLKKQAKTSGNGLYKWVRNRMKNSGVSLVKVRNLSKKRK